MQENENNSDFTKNDVNEDIAVSSESFSFDEDDFAYSEEDFSYEDTSDVSEDMQNNDDVQGEEDMGKTAVNKSARRAAKSRRNSEKKSKKLSELLKKAKLPLIICGCAVLGIIIGMFFYSLSTIDEERVMNNVYIENLDVSGLTYEDTLAAVNATYLFEKSQITLTDGVVTYPIIGADIGLAAIPEETAQKAFDYCKDGNVFSNAFRACVLLFKPHVIVPAPQLDEALLDEKLNECGNIMLGERIQHYVEFTDGDIAMVHSGQTGYNGDPSVAHDEVMTSLNNEDFTNIHVDFTSAPPDDMTVESLDLLIYKDPVDAKYEINGNEVTVVPGETGRYINKEEIVQFIPSIYEGCEPVGVPYYVSQPEVTSEELQEKLFANTLASYSTNYGGSTANRAANVARAASLINGSVVAPGEVFSFNDTVGHRTTENGFYTAKEYINGESVDGIGGGTCQVSSTLYSAVLYADLGIVERLNHMMSVGYIPLGQDATVSDGGVDFKFRNTSDYPIKISAYTSGSTITVTIIGTAWDPPREVKISNSSSMVGENTVVYSTRSVYSNGELVSTDRLNSSTYMPHKQAQSTAASSSSASSSSSNSSSSYDDEEDDEDYDGDDGDYDTGYDDDSDE